MDLTSIFLKPLTQWLEIIEFKLIEWNNGFLAHEKWEPIDTKIEPRILFSSSLTDMFEAIHASIDFLMKVNINPDISIPTYFEKIRAMVHYYTKKVRDTCIQDISNQEETPTSLQIFIDLAGGTKTREERMKFTLPSTVTFLFKWI